MKTLLKTLVLIISLSAFTTSYAIAKPIPSKKVVVIKGHKPKLIVYKNVKYYRDNGIWYKKKRNKYVVVKAPVGARIATLPMGCKKVRIKGVTYYRCKGVFYKKSGRKFIIVNV
ncbi:hypothetical protein AB832_05465 [Flavobacteriaceae bacterium (ex Bugula neritina AB1)]|nr:hypothetical protein AB832_05465 [Flavobacteriaceae bacterium (ex Bugula neritina AB1)]